MGSGKEQSERNSWTDFVKREKESGKDRAKKRRAR